MAATTAIMQEIKSPKPNSSPPPPPPPLAATTRTKPSPLVVLSICLVLLGGGGPLLLRVYFVHGGGRLWLSTLLQTAGWPLLLLPVTYSLLHHRHRATARLLLPPRLAVASAVLGVLLAVSNYLASLSSQALPLTTSALLLATQLVFTAGSAFLLVGLRFTPFSANAVVLLTVGPAVLGLGSSSGKPAGEAAKKYWTGFGEAIAAAALSGLLLPLIELAMARYGRPATEAAPATPSYATVMQMQAVMGAAATTVSFLAMAITGDFQAMPKEALEFGLGNTNYYLIIIGGAVSWQLLSLGIVGLITCASSLLAGIMIAVLLPLSEVLAVIFLHEKFDGTKGIALVLSLWGFVSYHYGERLQMRSLEAKKTEPDLAKKAKQDLQLATTPGV